MSEAIYDAAVTEPFDAARWATDEAVLSLGLAWIDERLAGEAGEDRRAAYLAARARLRAEGQPATIDRLAERFGLSAFEEDVLLIALAPAIDGSFGPRYGAAQGRLTASPATPHLLAMLLFGGDRLPARALECLTRRAPLRRFALLRLDDSQDLLAAAALTLAEPVAEALCGLVPEDGDQAPGARRLVPPPLPRRLEALATRVARAAGERLRMQIVGRKRSGRSALAAAILERLGLLAFEARPGGVSAPILARDAMIAGAGVVLDCDDFGEDALEFAQALDALLDAPVILVAQTSIAGMASAPVLRLEPLEADERAELWGRSAADLDEAAIRMAAEQFALGPRQIDVLGRRRDLADRGVWTVCRDLEARDLEALSTRVTPSRTWDDIVLDQGTRADLEALAAQVTGRAQVHGAWGYRRLMGRASGVSALFAGPSGVGKTLAAEILASALELDLYLVDLARVTSKYIGETEKNLRRIFDAAEGAGAVLFFDEADALFGKRSEVKDSHDRYANAEISYLLQRMETYGGVAILATNLKSHMDTAFLRRLRMIVDFPMPDVLARADLWRRAIPKAAPQSGIDWDQLARLELSGGNITTIAVNAAFRAAADRAPIGMRHLRAAIGSELRKLDRDASGFAGW